MKICVVLVTIFLVAACDGQTHPMAWQREQRDQRSRTSQQDLPSELLINTDRLMSSLEGRVLSIIRSETNAMKQQMNRLEQTNVRLELAISLIKNDVTSILEAIRDERAQDEQGQSKPAADLAQKLDNLNLLVSAVRGTVGKVERDVMMVKKNLRSLHNTRHSQPQFALVPTQNEAHHGDHHATCSAVDSGESGVRKVHKNFFAFCEMSSDDAGGWIVIQNRIDGAVDFFRPWDEYKAGFGNIAGEFWLGLDKIHELTSSRLYELMIVMESFDGTKKTAKYSAFAIADESSMYALNLLGAYSGDAEDSLKYHAGMKFSTFDNDNDAWTDGNCARSHFGGWWYNSCDETNLNGRYFEEGKVEAANNYQGIYWSLFNGSMDSLKSVKMMIRPVEA